MAALKGLAEDKRDAEEALALQQVGHQWRTRDAEEALALQQVSYKCIGGYLRPGGLQEGYQSMGGYLPDDAFPRPKSHPSALPPDLAV